MAWWLTRIENLETRIAAIEHKVARLEETLQVELAAQKLINSKTVKLCQETALALERAASALISFDGRLKPIEGEMSNWKDFTHWVCKTEQPAGSHAVKTEKN